MRTFSIFKAKSALLLAGLALLPFSLMGQGTSAADLDVNTVDVRQSRGAYAPNQVIVKFKSGIASHLNKKKRAPFRASGTSAIDSVFAGIGVTELEPLMPLTGAKTFQKKMRSFNGGEVEAGAMDDAYLLYLNGTGAVSQAVEQLVALSEVEFAEPNYLVWSLATEQNNETTQPDDPYYSLQYGLQDINQPELVGKPVISKEGPVIAILDTGVDTEHPDLKANIWVNEAEQKGAEGYDDDGNGFDDDLHGWDFINNTGAIYDYNGHGTHCAGIAAATGWNGLGIVGANPYARIMPVTVMQSNGTGDIATIIKGVDYAAAAGADVISMSLGTYAESSALQQALGRAYQNAVLVAAAGNDGLCINTYHFHIPSAAPMFPAAYTFVLGVQATDTNGDLAGFSNYDDDGPIFSMYDEEKLYNYELKAPGVAIMSTFPGGQYKQLNGTSMACPLVAGALSRLLQAKEYGSREELFGDLIHSVTSKGNVDFAAAYAMSDTDRKPELQFLGIDMVDADGDGRPDAGETLEFYPVIRNAWGNISGITLTIESNELVNNVFETVQGSAEFGKSLSGYGKARSLNPLTIRLKDDVSDGRIVRLKFTASAPGCEIIENEMEITVENGEEIGGVIASDMTLYPGKHYIVTRTLAIPEDVTLTILPGTRLKFRDNTGIRCAEGNREYSSDVNRYPHAGKIIAKGKVGNMIYFDGDGSSWCSINFGYNSEIEYCDFGNFDINTWRGSYSTLVLTQASSPNNGEGYYNNCVIRDSYIDCFQYDTELSSLTQKSGKSNLIGLCTLGYVGAYSFNNNICNNFNSTTTSSRGFPATVLTRTSSNFVSNELLGYNLGIGCDEPMNIVMEQPSYFGSSNPVTVKKGIGDIDNGYMFGSLDVSNMLTRPMHEAHGVVWKVVVDGYDAQDEFDQLPPLGVGEHKFEVWFNRSMNKEKAPMIAMGVRPPYTQTTVAEKGSWRTEIIDGDDIDVYTAYLTINGKMNVDGLNRIYVAEAEDDEFFEIPLENKRFNVEVSAAGSLSEGFSAEAGLGRVNLTWENPEENFDDMLGYNMYRYTVDEAGEKSEPVQINRNLIEPDETTLTDYDVVPGTTYCYYYKVMRTDLAENDPSKTVAVTPLTATAGDANGSGGVDVADVITTVNYAAGMKPKPFIFEAADMNADTEIDILDVVGIIRTILDPGNAASASVEASASYYVENGQVFVDSPVELSGVQFTVEMPDGRTVTGTEALDGFEQTGAWINDADYLFMAYNLSGRTIPVGKHALVNIGKGLLKAIVLSDVEGHNVQAVPENTTGLDEALIPPYNISGVYNMMGIKIADDSSVLDRLPGGIYIVNGKKVVKR